ncbi:MAG: hypothetical protein K6F60_01495 [Eubacterium sp.]|nr:hypothetical protein [Eubacterium sp.]
MKRRTIKKLLAILLPIAIVICSLQVGGIDRVEAEASDTLVIKASEISTSATVGEDGYSFYGLELDLPKNTKLILDKDFVVTWINCSQDLIISSDGNHTLTFKSVEGESNCYPELRVDQGDLTVNSGVTIDYYSTGISIRAINMYINGGILKARYVSECPSPIIEASESIKLTGGSYIKKPEGGKISEKANLANMYGYVTILDADGKGAIEVEIDVKAVTPEPEKAADETPAKEEEKSSDSSKKSYKNEWVNGQWYDADGKTSYKYKGGWKVNATGWWYEDENGWFPTNMWQKIDGDWYFFHEDGYMAENEYAGKWELYSEGYWWVGSDGRWDGSEPGVWRLVGTKWWFKDSTGWYAKGKWYKIGGTWYEFDNDGWWIEK